mmetsp:Transcript_38496/g.58588  ORF Transcript_38496/g.58588 Transcript_38496/m.58588 type:complete len:104 (+) Transcript_38496:861-1172(+)
MEGTSARNIKRKCRFTEHIDHLNHPNSIINNKMKRFFSTTKEPNNFNLRDTSLEQASKELERKQIQLMRYNRQFDTLHAYRQEFKDKNKFFEKIKSDYPNIGF